MAETDPRHFLHRLAPEVREFRRDLFVLGEDLEQVRRALVPRDGQVALAFLERWLHWFFCRFRHGVRLDRLTCDGLPLGWARGGGLEAFLDALEAPVFRAEAFLGQAGVQVLDSVF